MHQSSMDSRLATSGARLGIALLDPCFIDLYDTACMQYLSQRLVPPEFAPLVFFRPSFNSFVPSPSPRTSLPPVHSKNR